VIGGLRIQDRRMVHCDRLQAIPIDALVHASGGDQ
jgi:hypothetical protein